MTSIMKANVVTRDFLLVTVNSLGISFWSDTEEESPQTDDADDINWSNTWQRDLLFSCFSVLSGFLRHHKQKELTYIQFPFTVYK